MLVIVPVETIVGRVGDGWRTLAPLDEMAWSSGVLMIISAARLISTGLAGAGADFGVEATCFWGIGEVTEARRALSSAAGGRAWVCDEIPKASSATFSPTG